MSSTVYLDLTREFNRGRLRAVICSGQAVVLHRLAVMSKDGDSILREDDEAFAHVLSVLDGHGARYRFGAPLATPWMQGGWSAHFEFARDGTRVRTDFFTRPPRVTAGELERTWREQAASETPFVDARVLIEMKKTNREKDYAVIGELARLLPDVRDQLLASRSARDIAELAARHPDLVRELAKSRPLLARISGDRRDLERALDDERRGLMEEHGDRLRRYAAAAAGWSAVWADLERELTGLRLLEAHRVVVDRASRLLPCDGGDDPTRSPEPRDEFLSEEDLDLKNLSWDELIDYWNHWLDQAQGTNDLDRDEYSHGVFVLLGPSYAKRLEEIEAERRREERAG